MNTSTPAPHVIADNLRRLLDEPSHRFGETAIADELRHWGRLAADAVAPPKRRIRAPHRFLPAHLRVVVLLCESQGSTHTRLERAWAAKAARTGADAWPMVAASGLRTRVSELVRWGIVEPAGTHGRTVSNRPARVWQLTTDKTRRAAIAAGTARHVEAIAPDTRDALAALLDQAGADIVTRAALESVASAAGLRA